MCVCVCVQITPESDLVIRNLVKLMLRRLASRGMAHVEVCDGWSRACVVHALALVNDVLTIRGGLEAVAILTEKVSHGASYLCTLCRTVCMQ